MIKPIIENIRQTAKLHVCEEAVRIGSESEFPWDIWREFGKAGILGLFIPQDYGGTGLCARNLSEALHELVHEGGNLGLGLSVMIHSLVSGYVIKSFAPDAIKDKVLPLMASGDATCSFAVSEPGRGGHPKYIETRALKKVDEYGDLSFIVSGDKTYLTNGPIADYFIVIAITDEPDGGRRRFSAIMADASGRGIEIMPRMNINFFRPSPHGGVRLCSYNASADDLIGIEGSAYDDIVIPFRDTENCFMAGPVSGAMRRIALEAARLGSSSAFFSKEVSVLVARLEATADLSMRVAWMMADAYDSGAAPETRMKLYFQFREVCRIFHTIVDELELSEFGKSFCCDIQTVPGILINDLRRSAGLGDFVLKSNLAKAGFRLASCLKM